MGLKKKEPNNSNSSGEAEAIRLRLGGDGFMQYPTYRYGVLVALEEASKGTPAV